MTRDLAAISKALREALDRCRTHGTVLDPNGHVCIDCLREYRTGRDVLTHHQIMRGELPEMRFGA